ncbi:MAG: endolytic transglycosylase MltG [bacterium]|nr:endolytic transglycosylase MltG [bacterium]
MKKRILEILIVGVAIGSAVGIVVNEVNSPAKIGDSQEKLFSVRRGEGAFEIAANLEKEKLVKNQLFFDAAVIFLNSVKHLQAGDYYLSSEMTPLGIAKKLIRGDVVKQTVTIPEGWNLKEIDSYLNVRGLFKRQQFLTAASRDYSAEFGFLKDKPARAGLEGYLFPDTYELENGGTAEDLIANMLKNLGDKLTPELRTEIEKQKKTIFEIITMASLIEEEVKTLEEKKLVSGILWKRLRVGMRLQVDATIIYALGTKPDRVTYEQTKIDSPYNTYRYAGLPPGPIANPGLDSIVAAIYPTDSLYWYYLSTPAGQTLFSRTLEEHNIKKVKYLNL